MSVYLKGKTEIPATTKFIFFIGKVETLSFFSLAIKENLEKLGFSCFVFDFDEEFESYARLVWFADEHTVLLTFNFIGLSGEELFQEKDGETFFDQRGVICVNYLVDHPAYYPKQFQKLPKKYMQFCVDREHVRFTETYYPRVRYSAFLSLAGSSLGEGMDYEKRPMDIVFAGNYTSPDTFLPFQNRLGAEESAFYQEIIDYFKEYPDTGLTEGISRFFLRDFPDIKRNELRDGVINTMFIDLHLRFHFRGEVIKNLAEHGFSVHLYGSGWEKLDTDRKDQLILHGPADTAGCLKAMSQSKISLNIMPWFKEGAHDRVYSGMLCGSVVLSDKSRYMTETIKEGACFFDLKEPESLIRAADDILSQEEKSKEIAEIGRHYAAEHHTWEKQTYVLLSHIKASAVLDS